MGEKSSMRKIERPIRQPVIKPEEGGSTIVNVNIGERAVSREFIIDYFPKVAVGPCNRCVKKGSIP
jgi:hypothetical protein